MSALPHGQVVAIGDLGIHHVISAEDDARWTGSRHADVAVRVAVAVSGERAAAVLGSAGADEHGAALVRDLRDHAVDLGLRSHGEPTRQAFQVQDPPPRPLFSHNRPILTARCQVCDVRHAGSRAPRLEAERWLADQARGRADAVFVFDRLSELRRRIAAGATKRGSTSVLALQRPEPLRFQPAVQLVAALEAFDLVVLGWRVARTLEHRLGFSGAAELARAAGTPSLVTLEPSGVAHVALDAGRRLETTTLSDREGGLEEAAEAVLRGAVRSWHAGMELDERVSALEAAVARTPPPGHDTIVALPRLRRGVTLRELKDRLANEGVCPLCLATPRLTRDRTPQRRRPPGARTNVGWLLRRAFAAVERPQAVAAVKTLLQLPGTAYCVGSGGSFAVAAFAAQLLLGHGQLFAQPIRPMDYVRTARATDVVLVVSYSGSTPDAAAVIERARELGAGRIVLLSAPGTPALAELLRPAAGDLLLSYGNPRRGGSRERGFVSIAATIAPCVLLTAAVEPAEAFADLDRDLATAVEDDAALSRQLAEAVGNSVPLAVLGGAAAWPAMLDIESKWAEAALGPLTLHEAKDFSHGRFISVLGGTRHQPLMLAAGGLADYERLLMDVLADLSPQLLTTRRTGLLGTLELLIRCQFVAERVARNLDRDISRPEYIPDDALKLYRWKGSLRAGEGTAREPRD